LSVHWSRINFIIIRIHSWNFSHPCDCLSEIDAKFMNAPQLIFPKQCWTMVEFVTHLRGFSQRIKFSLHFRYSFSKCKDSMKITFLLQGIQSAVSTYQAPPMTHICLGETQFNMEVSEPSWSKRIRFCFRHGPTSAKNYLAMEKPWARK